MDLTYKVIKSIVKKKKGFGANGGFDFTKELKEMLIKNIGVWSKWWICFTKEKRELLRKKKGFGANSGFGYTKEKRELIVKNYEKKEGVWAQWWI